MSLRDRFLPVMAVDSTGRHHLLGTDGLGRDMVSRLAYSARYSLIIAVSAALVTTLFAIVLGLSAGYVGGTYDAIVMRAVDALLSMPVILMAVALAAIIGRGLGTLVVILAITGWANYTRVLRAEALALRDSMFVESARAIGCGTLRVLVTHVLPNTLSVITVMSTFSIGRFILLESSISFLGMGISPPRSSWGVMIGDAQQYLFEAPMASVLPGVMIVLAVLAINFLGDALRDKWDPHARHM
ncbi:MAG: ABC transporter permease [Candidatus Bipolaricaulis sp.]|nr:ABC transporter permease [Candidatus Bipolaricaulis sp.]